MGRKNRCDCRHACAEPSLRFVTCRAKPKEFHKVPIVGAASEAYKLACEQFSSMLDTDAVLGRKGLHSRDPAAPDHTGRLGTIAKRVRVDCNPVGFGIQDQPHGNESP